MDELKLIQKIMEKPELRNLPVEDVEMALSLCAKKDNLDEENIKCTREVLHSVYGAFSSRKLLSPKEKDAEWILRKHISTRERLPHYSEIYSRILKQKKTTIFDLGAGVNGFSLGFVPKNKYVAVEGVGQLVDLMNGYFKKEKLNGKAIHLSLFRKEKIKELIKREKGKKIVYLFKVLDSLETLKRDYSKELLEEVVPLVDRVVISLATRSFSGKTKFKVQRYWILSFIEQNFKIIDDFELGGERYIVFEGKKK